VQLSIQKKNPFFPEKRFKNEQKGKSNFKQTILSNFLKLDIMELFPNIFILT